MELSPRYSSSQETHDKVLAGSMPAARAATAGANCRSPSWSPRRRAWTGARRPAGPGLRLGGHGV